MAIMGKHLRCSLCSRSKDEVKVLYLDPGSICTECLAKSNELEATRQVEQARRHDWVSPFYLQPTALERIRQLDKLGLRTTDILFADLSISNFDTVEEWFEAIFRKVHDAIEDSDPAPTT
ncbi:hypothetical protein KW785_02765 [Candidatus Parcubacteria bacterium]|nr:hypothetical protein [Candidatus Parcubacteria bacterium]